MHLSAGRDDVFIYQDSGHVGWHCCIHLQESIDLDRVELGIWSQQRHLAGMYLAR
jgi:hypothetical protein